MGLVDVYRYVLRWVKGSILGMMGESQSDDLDDDGNEEELWGSICSPRC